MLQYMSYVIKETVFCIINILCRESEMRASATKNLNPYLMNGFPHHYHLGESTFIFRGVTGVILNFIQFFDENVLSKQNSPRWDAAWHLGLFCLPMSHKRDARLN